MPPRGASAVGRHPCRGRPRCFRRGRSPVPSGLVGDRPAEENVCSWVGEVLSPDPPDDQSRSRSTPLAQDLVRDLPQQLVGLGGWASYQVTCTTSGGDTWPDSVTLEARDLDDHTFVTVQGHTASTADEREGVFWFATGAEVRVSIVDAAGSHSCTASLAFGQFGDY